MLIYVSAFYYLLIFVCLQDSACFHTCVYSYIHECTCIHYLYLSFHNSTSLIYFSSRFFHCLFLCYPAYESVIINLLFASSS